MPLLFVFEKYVSFLLMLKEKITNYLNDVVRFAKKSNRDLNIPTHNRLLFIQILHSLI